MSDIAGPPAPKDVQPSVRATDKAAYVAKDPNNQQSRPDDTPRERTPQDQQDQLKARDPAVSIAATTAHLQPGQTLKNEVERIDAEGRPIIKAETVTVALKPDAGLKPHDSVELKIVEADKRLTADLVLRNDQPIDPPIRLSVTVIEIHGGADTAKAATHLPEPTDKPYKAPAPTAAIVSKVRPGADSVSTDVAMLIAKQQADGKPATTPPAAPEPPSAALPRASSADLATLIQQQQGQAPAKTPPASTTVTPAATTPFAAAEGAGIGPAIPAVSLAGANTIVQLLDPAVSRVSPVEIATVLSVKPLTAAEARGLPVGTTTLSSIAGQTGELVRLETSRGDFVLPAQPASSLAGELIRLVVDTAAATQPKPDSQNAPTQLQAQFTATGAEGPSQRVTALFNAPVDGQQAKAEPSATIHATITSVQTNGVFLSPDGPKTDYKIQTDAGTVLVSAPSAFRPEVGGTVALNTAVHATASPVVEGPISQQVQGALPQSIQAQSAQPQNMPPITVSADAALAAAQTIPPATIVPNMLSTWPAMEESVAALASAGTLVAGADSLAAKSAQGGGKLTNSLLFFLAAAGRGGPTAWLGQGAERALAAASPALLKSLQSDIRRMASLPGETIGDWRPIVLPFDARPGEVPLAALLVQAHDDIDPDEENGPRKDDGEDNDKSQRFILQVQFSVLGDIQLDGNIRKTQFDMTVRSAGQFSLDLKQDLENLFTSALSANGYTGGLAFQENATFPVDAAAMIEQHLRQHPS